MTEDYGFIAQLLTSMLIQNCPKDKGNLVNTIGYEVYNDGFRVFIGGDALLSYASAPYAHFTNDSVSKNYRKVYPGQPLYHWIEKTIEQVVTVIEGS